MTKEELNQKVKILKWDFDNWVYQQEEKAKWLWDYHSKEAIAFVPVAIVTAERLIRGARYDRNRREEKYLKERTIYDRSNRCRIELKRKLTNREILELDRRRKNGESLIEILTSMRVVKK